MSTTLEELKPALLKLSGDERYELAEFLYESLPNENQEFDEEFLKEISRRADEVDSGQVTGRSLDEIRSTLKDRFG